MTVAYNKQVKSISKYFHYEPSNVAEKLEVHCKYIFMFDIPKITWT